MQSAGNMPDDGEGEDEGESPETKPGKPAAKAKAKAKAKANAKAKAKAAAQAKTKVKAAKPARQPESNQDGDGEEHVETEEVTEPERFGLEQPSQSPRFPRPKTSKMLPALRGPRWSPSRSESVPRVEM